VRYGLDADHADTAQLLGSELVMNAVIHGRPPVVVRVFIEHDCTVLEVSDGSDELPATPGEDNPDHRGLRLVGALSSDWGSVPDETGGKTVWCTIAHATGTRAEPHSGGRRARDRTG
jgi:hypothetical protein